MKGFARDWQGFERVWKGLGKGLERRVPTFCVPPLGGTKTKHPPPSFFEEDRFFTRFVCKVFQMVSINNSTTQQPLNYINIRASVVYISTAITCCWAYTTCYSRQYLFSFLTTCGDCPRQLARAKHQCPICGNRQRLSSRCGNRQRLAIFSESVSQVAGNWATTNV